MKILNREIHPNVLWGALALVIMAGLIFGYKIFFHRSRAPVTGIYATPPPAAGMPSVPTKDVIIKVPLKVYDKKVAAKKMQLPPAVVDDPKKELVSTAKVKPSEGGYTIAAVTDTQTGVTEIITKEEPRPWFAFGGKSSIGALAGTTTKGPAALLYVSQDVLRIGPAQLGVVGGGGQVGTDLAAGVFVNARFTW